MRGEWKECRGCLLGSEYAIVQGGVGGKYRLFGIGDGPGDRSVIGDYDTLEDAQEGARRHSIRGLIDPDSPEGIAMELEEMNWDKGF
jgi:hypothetical protein